MTWTRIDENYDTHRKLLALGDGAKGDADRWTWTRVLVYTNRHDDASVPWNIGETIPRATRAFLTRCLTIGLLEETDDGGLVVHDWPLYANVTVAEKVAYYLTRKNPDASANDVARELVGKRELILAEVARFRGTDTSGTREPGVDAAGGGSREPEKVVLARVLPNRDEQEPLAEGSSSVSSPKAVDVARENGAGDTFDVRTLIDHSIEEATRP